MKHQAVVVLYYLYGLSLQETASVLDVRLGTVKSRIHYALRALRTQLEGDDRFSGAYRSSDPRIARLPALADTLPEDDRA